MTKDDKDYYDKFILDKNSKKDKDSESDHDKDDTKDKISDDYKSKLDWYYQRHKKRIILGISLTLAVILIVAGAVILIKNMDQKKKDINNLKSVEIANTVVVDKQYIKDSIKAIEPYETKLINMTLDKKQATQKFNNRSISIKQYLSDLNSYNKNCTTATAAITKINCATEVNQLKIDVSSEYRDFQQGLTHETNFVNNRDQKEMNMAAESYGDFMQTYQNNKAVLQNAYSLCK